MRWFLNLFRYEIISLKRKFLSSFQNLLLKYFNSAPVITDYFTITPFDTLSDATITSEDPPFQFYFSADASRSENRDGVTNWKLKPATITHSLFSSYTYFSTDGPIDFSITGSQSQNVPFEISVVYYYSDNI